MKPFSPVAVRCRLVAARAATAALLVLFAQASSAAEAPITKIGFGSCLHQDKPEPIWNAILAQHADVFLFLGDNVYANTFDPAVLRTTLAKLGNQPGYEQLKRESTVLATWDDHDYGDDDTGAEHPAKERMKEVFLDFFGEPRDSPRRAHAGIYTANVFGPPERRVRAILLDTRTFRSPLAIGRADQSTIPGHVPYIPNLDPAATMLGDAQWSWLERQLAEPAALTILASSVQVIANDHGWEKWGNFPRERERLLGLIRDAASPVVIVSGDRHRAELSRLEIAPGRTLYDLTSSSLNLPIPGADEKNTHRVGSVYQEANFGLITLDWRVPAARIEIRSLTGETVLAQTIPLRAPGEEPATRRLGPYRPARRPRA